MRLRVVTGDPVFRAAVTGLAGALGHSIADEDSSDGAVAIWDVGTIDFDARVQGLDPLHTVIFVPSNPGLAPNQAALGAFIHVAPRTALAVELPRLLALLAE